MNKDDKKVPISELRDFDFSVRSMSFFVAVYFIFVTSLDTLEIQFNFAE